VAGGDARVSPLSNSRVQTSLDWWIKIPVTGRNTKLSSAPLSSGRFWGRMCLMAVMRKGPEMLRGLGTKYYMPQAPC
jgi:hypothetical protein